MTEVEFQIHVVDALARLDTKVGDLVGNGKPGRVANLESDVKKLNEKQEAHSRRIAWYAGLIIGATGTISAIIHWLFRY